MQQHLVPKCTYTSHHLWSAIFFYSWMSLVLDFILHEICQVSKILDYPQPIYILVLNITIFIDWSRTVNESDSSYHILDLNWIQTALQKLVFNFAIGSVKCMKMRWLFLYFVWQLKKIQNQLLLLVTSNKYTSIMFLFINVCSITSWNSFLLFSIFIA